MIIIILLITSQQLFMDITDILTQKKTKRNFHIKIYFYYSPLLIYIFNSIFATVVGLTMILNNFFVG